MAANVSKIELNNTTYEIKDRLARQDLSGYVNKDSAEFTGSIKMESASFGSAEGAVALGNESAATGDYSSTLGNGTLATGVASNAEGDHTSATGRGAHSEGVGVEDPVTHNWTNSIASGEGAHCEGKYTQATGNHSHSEGCETIASGHASHAQGCTTRAAASYSHVEGQNNAVTSTVDLDGLNETGIAAHVEGGSNISAASYSHVEGYGNEVGINAQYAHVSGLNNKATFENNRVVIGSYNQNIAEDILEIGNGYVDPISGSTVRKTPVRLTKDNILHLSLNDAKLHVTINGEDKIFSLTEAVVVDDDLDELSTHPVQNKVVTEKLNEVFQSVSEGKKLIVDALTDLGVEASVDMDFSELADCIKSINPGYEVDHRYLFVRESKYVTPEGDLYPIPVPIEGESDGSFINFYTVQNE